MVIWVPFGKALDQTQTHRLVHCSRYRLMSAFPLPMNSEKEISYKQQARAQVVHMYACMLFEEDWIISWSLFFISVVTYRLVNTSWLYIKYIPLFEHRGTTGQEYDKNRFGPVAPKWTQRCCFSFIGSSLFVLTLLYKIYWTSKPHYIALQLCFRHCLVCDTCVWWEPWRAPKNSVNGLCSMILSRALSQSDV